MLKASVGKTKGMEKALFLSQGSVAVFAGCKKKQPGKTSSKKRTLTQSFIIMKLILLLTTAACLQASAIGYSQTISLSFKNTSLEKVFIEIEKQSGYSFVYTREELGKTIPVTIEVKDATLNEVLELCFRKQPITYNITDKYIIVKEREEAKQSIFLVTDIRGKVINEKGEAVAGATVKVKGSSIITITNNEGEFLLNGIEPTAILIITGAELEAQEIKVNNRSFVTVRVNTKVNDLDQVVIMAYGETTKRLNTGNISKVTGNEISKQPVANPLAALQGRVPGLIITQSSGYAGSTYQIQIRGQNSLLQGSQPLFVIDGVPFATGNNSLNQINNAIVISPFYTVNPSDIESIEILKDADATAIYGSRGANGVILITTKNGKEGKTKVELTQYYGINKVTRTMNMLNTQQYAAMRNEAQINDGVPATATNSADIMVWDTTRYTDFKRKFIGGTANTSDIGLSISGGSSNTRFRLGGGFHRETTVLPTDLADTRSSVDLSINHNSTDKKLQLNLKTFYSAIQNNLPYRDLTSTINAPPNMKLYDSAGKLNWEEGGITYRSLQIAAVDANPLAILETSYRGEFQNLTSNLLIGYKLSGDLNLKTSLGYNLVLSDEVRIHPSKSIDPFSSQLPYSYFANRTRKSWIIEPQIEYIKQAGKGKLTILAGTTWQENTAKGISADASNYTSDLTLNSISGAGTVITKNSYSQYRYSALFGRVHYNWKTTYIINLSGRRDGSSRFGPKSRFSNFGAAGVAWIFSNESFIKKVIPVMSFGKFRGSYGITGNDQIPDYLFIDTWNTGSVTYQQSPILLPSALFNPNLAWEANNKLEVAFDLGFFKDRILFSASWFRNRSGNQLINYALPIQTGFTSIAKNFEALIQNKGIEVSMQSKNILTSQLQWNTFITISFIKNKLLKFPGLETSTYANNYVIGQPLSVRKLYHYTEVDPLTGVYQYTDVDNSGTYNSTDRFLLKNTDPIFYGGFQNSISYKGFQADIFLEFRKQTGINYLGGLRIPGYRYFNQPIIVLERWQKPGDITSIQRFTANTNTQAYKNGSNLDLSDVAFSDASYIRCKNISISYDLPVIKLGKLKISLARIFLHCQNVFTITKYTGSDPETQNINALPPMRTITGGIQLVF